MTHVNERLIDVISFLLLGCCREKEDDLERRFVLLDQELRDILAIEGNQRHFLIEFKFFFLSLSLSFFHISWWLLRHFIINRLEGIGTPTLSRTGLPLRVKRNARERERVGVVVLEYIYIYRRRSRSWYDKRVAVHFNVAGSVRDICTVQPPCLLSRLSLRDVGGTRERRE
jgi:hypothetical protein